MSQTILIVDDSPTLLKFVSVSLKANGYEVVTACDGMEAIERLSTLSQTVDLVITDLNMPNLDGFALIETLRSSNQHRTTPIIILSSEEGEDDRERGLEVGASSYLVKPFKVKPLLDEVKRVLKSKTVDAQ